MYDFDPLNELFAVIVGAFVLTLVVDVILIVSDPTVFQ
jgi:hypothetical protein